DSTHTILVPILRSGMSMLPVFMSHFEQARVGVVGFKRDEKTAIAHEYYANVPPMSGNEDVIILDPMIATGGTAVAIIRLLLDRGVREDRIHFVAIIGSKEGLQRVHAAAPHITLICAAEDPHMNKDKFIVPGLGDF